jgi:hypothetical protein
MSVSNRLLLVSVSDVWHRIESVATPLLDSDGVTGEDLRLECEAGRALCFASLDGVTIVTLVPNRWRKDHELFIWLAVSTGPHGATEQYLPELEQVARDLGAARMVFRSSRPGWERKLPPNWKLREIEYACEL